MICKLSRSISFTLTTAKVKLIKVQPHLLLTQVVQVSMLVIVFIYF